ncbi:helix-turn-helix domain-containing protein [Rhizobium sp. P28RR-XV]|uniref:helix-turn-helix domain-containing protein n=1 Tax=Rhizobium sp. P28RR-XV TaxID=2726737 RepID=UPI0014568DAC|nr:AraC family transcriptional regulator [Rhizobium sp. P28RR-XV]NLR85554.1 helix-turn-helix transcriptional regulator [Rhizobium sp. P28RR-XV]
MMWGKADISCEQPKAAERRRWPRSAQMPLYSEIPESTELASLPFSTEELRPDRQFAAWQERMAPLIDMRLQNQAKADEPFAVKQVAWNLEGVLLIQQEAPAFSFERSAEKVRFSSIDHWQITFLRTGKTWTSVNGNVVENEPGMMEIRMLGYPFYGRTLPARSTTLILPCDLFAAHGGLPSASSNIVLGGERVSLLSSYIDFLEVNLLRLTRDDLPSIRNQLREMVFHTISPLVHGQIDGEISQSGLMTRARHFIQNNLGSAELTPETLSRELAISRTRLYELFQTSSGVLNYIRRRRLLAARAALNDPADGRKIGEIANQFAFESAANFCRAFTHEFGYNPSEVRRHSRDFKMEAPSRTAVSSFDNWLSTLGL